MCGIAGVIRLDAQSQIPRGLLYKMSQSIWHRGPDEDGFFEEPGIGLAARRLSIVGLSDGSQPVTNESRTVSVVFNGELFDYPHLRRQLESSGHTFRTQTDTELVPHLWDDHQEGMFQHLRGQFAFALWDSKRERLILARDRFGICPLYWTRVSWAGGEWLLFGSEIKAILASGLVRARLDPAGLNQAFSFFGMPGPATCFDGIQALQPGRFLTVQRRGAAERAQVRESVYWDLEFPDAGDERDGDETKLVDQLEERMLAAIDRRLRADVPIVSYLSGGVDSSLVVAMASSLRNDPIPTFTIQVDDPSLDERNEAAETARHTASHQTVIRFGTRDMLAAYPKLIWAGEGPVVDTSCGALLALSAEVRRQGFKVALTGEGSDEWLAGYPWFKMHRVAEALDQFLGFRLGRGLRDLFVKSNRYIDFKENWLDAMQEQVGGPNAWLDVYGMMSGNRDRFFAEDLKESLGQALPFAGLGFDAGRMRRWNSINRSIYVGAKIHLPGLLLNHKGDRIAMANSVETRYPFLDEDVVGFLASLHPRWKMRGLGDKHILRLLAERWLPKQVAWRRKAMFRAPNEGFHSQQAPPFVEQLLSEESLRKTGYFNPRAVRDWRTRVRTLYRFSPTRLSIEMGLTAVAATQLWHHTFIDPSLSDMIVPTKDRALYAVG